jgi:two-component system LytT family sensor kinase
VADTEQVKRPQLPRRRWRLLSDDATDATFRTLHTASSAARDLREGLTPHGSQRAARHLRLLLGTTAVALVDTDRTLAWEGGGSAHADQAVAHAREVLRTGRTAVLRRDALRCNDPDCPIRCAVIVPLVSDDAVVGALAAYLPESPSAALVRATEETAAWVSGQVELTELAHERTRTVEAELRALRAQISPHFVYNSLAAIASFVRTDPERARELLLEFADFTRYAFKAGGDFTTLAAELRNVERYLALEQARFGDRLVVSLLIAPEVLPVALPYLAIQPLVENAVRHGLEGLPGPGQITITASDEGTEAGISVEDNGSGSDPEVIRRVLAGATELDGVGLANVDARLRQVYGDDYGLVVETAVGAGTKASFRVPKYAAGVHAS